MFKKQENVTNIFSFFPQSFEKVSFLRLLKVGIVWYKVIDSDIDFF